MTPRTRELIVLAVMFLLFGLILAGEQSHIWEAPTPTVSSWEATAYCKGAVTFAGIPVRRGHAASDPRVLPTGSIIRVSETGREAWDGIYSVLDTGPEIQGRELDLYFWSCYEALDFGRRHVIVEVLREGWAETACDPNRYPKCQGGGHE